MRVLVRLGKSVETGHEIRETQRRTTTLRRTSLRREQPPACLWYNLATRNWYLPVRNQVCK